MWLLHAAMAGNSRSVYTGAYVCAGLPISSKASRASHSELAVEQVMYSRTMGNTFHKANALNAKIISTPARSPTERISSRLRRNAASSST